MSKFNFIETPIRDLYVVEPTLYKDNRGYFFECYHKEAFAEGGIPVTFVQDNESQSRRGVLRGLHMQRCYPQGKLVRVLSGEVYDVAVDARAGSATFGKWFGVLLSAENKKMLYIPEGFLHGFLVLSETAAFTYKCTRYYHPEDEYGVMWNDPSLGIAWPDIGADLTVSDKDRRNNSFADYIKTLG